MDALALLEQLIRADGDGAEAVDDLMANAMRQAGAEVETFDYEPASVPLIDEFARSEVATTEPQRCLIGRIDGHNPKNGKSLLLFAHPDTEAMPSNPAWQTEPRSPTRTDGRLYGWGVADDLAGMAMLATAPAILRQTGIALAGDIILVSAPSKRHRRGIAAALNHGLDADGAIYLHPAESGRGLNEIKAFAPGQLEFSIHVHGRAPETNEPAHTAFAHRGENAIGKLTKIAAALQACDQARATHIHHPRLQSAIGRSTNLMLSHIAAGNVGQLSRMPVTGTLSGALTLVPGEALETVMAEVEGAVAQAADNDAWLCENRPEVTWHAGVSAAETVSADPLYQTVENALRQVGASPTVNPLHTSSDIRNPTVQRGIPTVGFGPFCGGLAMSGQTDEWVDISDFERAVQATANIIEAWCGSA